MKLQEAIDRVDALKSNTFTTGEKVAWISELDGRINTEILAAYGDSVPFEGYTDPDSLQAELLVPAPYDVLYMHWLEAQIDYYHGEFSRYNNTAAQFEMKLQAFKDHCVRTGKTGNTAFKGV